LIQEIEGKEESLTREVEEEEEEEEHEEEEVKVEEKTKKRYVCLYFVVYHEGKEYKQDGGREEGFRVRTQEREEREDKKTRRGLGRWSTTGSLGATQTCSSSTTQRSTTTIGLASSSCSSASGLVSSLPTSGLSSGLVSCGTTISGLPDLASLDCSRTRSLPAQREERGLEESARKDI
jgi:hypothetical protein